MSGIFYYLPGRQTFSIEKAKEFGLGYAIGDGGLERVGMTPGPDGGSGVLFKFSDHNGTYPRSVEIKAGSFVWDKHPESDLWIGFDSEALPTPESLARLPMASGIPISMGDKRLWLIPAIRGVDGDTMLPCAQRWKGGDEWVTGEPKAEYRDIYEHAGRLWDVIFTGLLTADPENEDITFDVADECGIVCRALTVNYRIGRAEASMMGLIDGGSQLGALLAIIDFPGAVEVKKKMDSLGPDWRPGTKECTPATSPQSASS